MNATRGSALVARTAATNAVAAVVGLVTSILSARLLGPGGRGELVAVQLWGNLGGMVALLGLSDAVVYYSAREEGTSSMSAGTAIGIGCISATGVIAALYLLLPILLAAQRSRVVGWARGYLLIIPIMVVGECLLGSLRGRRRFHAWNTLRLLPPVFWMTILLAAWILGRRDVGDIVEAYLVARGFVLLIVFWSVRQSLPGQLRFAPGRAPRLMRYGLQSIGSDAPRMVSYRADQLVMGALVGPRLLGLYSVAAAWGNTLDPVLTALGQVAFPEVASAKNSSLARRRMATFIRLGVVIALVILLGVALLTPLLLPWIFGRPFRDAVPVALVLLVGEAVVCVNRIVKDGMLGLGSPISNVRAELVGVVLGLPLLVVLVPAFRIMGAALASVGAYLGVLVVLLWQAKRLTKRSYRQLTVPTRGDVLVIHASVRQLWINGRSWLARQRARW